MTHCLDSWAVLRWLEGTEPAAERVDELLGARPVMSWINLGEVSYVVHRAAGADEARAVVRSLRGKLDLDAVTPVRVLAAADIRARYAMAYADAFAVATALARGAVLATGDPEILEADAVWTTEDLR